MKEGVHRNWWEMWGTQWHSWKLSGIRKNMGFQACFLLICIVCLVACASRPSPTPLIPPSPSPTLYPPDLANLLRVINYGIGLERDAWGKFDYPTFHGDFLTSPEARALFNFVQADFERYYPDGIPGAGNLFTDGKLDPNIWFPPRAVWTLAQTGVVELLRASGATLTAGKTLSLDPLTLTPIPLELDGDPTPEWLVEVTSETYNLHGWFPLDEQVGDPPGYTLMPNDIQHENLARAQGLTLHITPDLNGDELADLLVHFDGQPLGTQFGELKVYGRVEGKIALLDKIELKAEEIFEITETDIQVNSPRHLNFECSWMQTTRYQWIGAQKSYSVQDDTPPNTFLCGAALALSPLSNLLLAERITFLENALANLTVDTAPSADYLALLHLHLNIIYTAQGIDDESRLTISSSELAVLDSPFARQIQIYAHAARGRLWPLCNALYTTATQGKLDLGDLAPYFGPSAMFTAYGDSLASPAPLICPLQILVDSQLETFQLPAHLPPGEQQLELNIFLKQLSSYGLDQDAEPEWIGLLDLETPRVLLFDQEGALWKIHRIAQFDAPLSQLQTQITDFNEDGQPDILLLATLGPSVSVSQYPGCWEKGADQVSELVIISAENLEVETTTILCGEPVMLTTIPDETLREFVAEKPPQVPTLDDPRVFFQFLEQQEMQMLKASSTQNVRLTLETILIEETLGFPSVENAIPRILYDIGLSYEIERDAETARTAYLDLIAQWPQSPWAWLAEARISN